MKILKIVAVFMFIAVVGCTYLPVSLLPGDKPDEVPPKIMIGKDNSKLWDRPRAFGPIPAQLVENGKQVCGAMDMKAVGYHPNALDEKGKAFVGGGYLCAPK